MSRMAIISVDGHVTGSFDQFRDYVDAKHLDAYDSWVKSLESVGLTTLGNMKFDADPAMQWDSAMRLRDVESVGVVAEVLFPNGLPFQTNAFIDVGDVEEDYGSVARHVYNRWLADFCAEVPGRRAGQALVSFDDVDRAVKDVHWAKEHGLGGIMMPPLVHGSKYWFDPELDPIWAAVQEVGLPLSQHGGTGAPMYTPPGFASLITLSIEHAFFSGRSLWQMILGGVFDRFPDLHLAFVETEVDWIGPMIRKLDARMALVDSWTAFASVMGRKNPLDRKPSEYWGSNIWAGISPFSLEQAPVDQVVGEVGGPADRPFCFGTERSMFGVDYPHFEAIWPDTNTAVAALVGDPAVSEADARKVLYENAAALYGFDLDALEPDMERVGFTVDDVLSPVPA
jgi:predicted TIM-barrel fold metal-dependent hydrolase